MNITLKKIDWIRWTIYLITVIFLAYLIFICFFAKPDQFLFGNVLIKPVPIDFGGFGSLLAGIFAPLAFLWLFLNFRQQDKNLMIAEQQLKILLEERQARNEQLKPKLRFSKFEIITVNSVGKNSIILLSFLCESSIELKKCKVMVLDKKSPLFAYNKFASKHMDKEKFIYSIGPEEPRLIQLRLDLNKTGSDSCYEWSCCLSYINPEGYRQVEYFEVTFYSDVTATGELGESSFHVSNWRSEWA